MTLKIAILISGRGSNMMAIHQAIVDKKLDAKIQLIVSNKPDAAGFGYAHTHRIPVAVIEKKNNENLVTYDQRLIEKIESASVELVVLAGYMKLLSKLFTDHFRGRVINIHPSLLPAFPGLHAQKQALEAGVTESGCTVHFVDEGCDTGPIIAQKIVPITKDDNEESLSSRILVQEHILYPECLQLFAKGRVKLVEGRVLLL